MSDNDECLQALRTERARAEKAEGERDEARQDVDALKNVIAWGDREAEPFGYHPYGCEALPDFIAHLGRDRDVARQIVDGVHGALTDAGDVLVPCDRDADLAPAVRELVRQRDVARRRIWGLEAEVCTRLASEAILHCRLAEAETALETALAARCHSRTAVPGEPESPECRELPTMCDRHAHGLMAALREAESAAEALRVELAAGDGGDTP